jgi:hypothetical protein
VAGSEKPDQRPNQEQGHRIPRGAVYGTGATPTRTMA